MVKFTAEELTALDRYVSEAGQQQAPIPPDMLVRDHYYFQAIDGLSLAGSDANGVKRGGRIFHKEAGVTMVLPLGWPVVLRRQWAVAQAPDGMAYLTLSHQEVAARISPKKFMEKVFGHANLKSGDVEIVNRDKQGGFNARVVMETLYGRRSKQVKVIYVGTRAMILESVSAVEPPPQRYAKEIANAGRTLRPLKERESTLAGATQLEIKRVAKATTLRLLASPVKHEPTSIEQLRLLNQLAPGAEPRVGQYLKLVIEP
ncbi:MAG: hypothetical protein FD130_1747 [Halothiobacillaceae bacterium]|nr:MAG: hypothetical protein FD130_1747 [Halothiobacillaceae bacterium]